MEMANRHMKTGKAAADHPAPVPARYRASAHQLIHRICEQLKRPSSQSTGTPVPLRS
jgi:hypothetical protein